MKMKNILKKCSKFFLSALVILNSFTSTMTISAEETNAEAIGLKKKYEKEITELKK